MIEIPVWDKFLIHILQYLEDGVVRSRAEINVGAANHAGLTEAQSAVVLQSGQPKVQNRIGWAISFLTRIDAIERPSKARYRIAPLGRKLLEGDPGQVSESALKHLYKPSIVKSEGREDSEEPPVTQLDPIEQIEQGLERIHEAVSVELLTRLQSMNPTFFESAVVKLLVAMGYGGADGTASVTPQTNDGGIDGIIDRDALGLDRVYIQAKRYKSESSVQKPEVQAFVGALSGKASTGVFITTGVFSKGAVEYATSAHTRVILIDGRRLTELMLRYGVGVQTRRTLQLVAIDEDFFEGE